ncbi:response regulator transcription factor [Novosphingobium sp.]|uniref:response regulator transcription factor n=1 Tax=Novosphingobium sp. TaxID=1874826 RepID=UPI00260965F6|nr:response regulator transcription factor [Novosphingobium sp.]
MTVVLVEDDVGIGRAIVQGLSAQGLDVHWQRTGAGLLDRLVGGTCRALILDIGLPDTDGFTLCREVRAAGIDLPVLMLTARTALDDRLDGFAAGADDYLAKPFAFAELVARVAVLVRRGERLRPGPVRWEDLELDRDAATAQWQGVPLRLDPRSFAILAELATRRGGIVPRTQLVDAVWGSEAVMSDNAVDVAISTLRRRLADAGVPVAVRALRGQGFALERATGRRRSPIA